MRGLVSTSTGWSAALMLSSICACLIPGCKRAKPVKPRPKLATVVCKLPDLLQVELRAPKHALDRSARERRRLLERVHRNCSGWPGYIRKAIQYIAHAPPTWQEPLIDDRAPPLVLRPDYRRDAQLVCKDWRPVFQRLNHEQVPLSQWRDELWKRCDFSKAVPMTRRRFHWSITHATLAVGIFRMLRNGGMPAPLAMTIAQLFLADHDLIYRAQGIALPRGRSTTEPYDGVFALHISTSELRCGNKHVSRITDGQLVRPPHGSRGATIGPLLAQLTEKAQGLRSAATQGGAPFLGELLLLADRRTPVRLLVDVLATAAQAGFLHFWITTLHPDYAQRVGAIVVEFHGTRQRAGPPLPALTVSDSEYTIDFGVHVGKKTFPILPAQRGARRKALQQLSAHLHKALRNTSRRGQLLRAWGQILIKPDQGLRLAHLVLVLDAVRDSPGHMGCRFQQDAQSHRVLLSMKAHPACMYPYPILDVAIGTKPVPTAQ